MLRRRNRTPLDSVGFNISERSAVDLDSAPAPSLNPAPVSTPMGFEVDIIDDSEYGEADLSRAGFGEDNENGLAARRALFSDSLITSDDYLD